VIFSKIKNWATPIKNPGYVPAPSPSKIERGGIGRQIPPLSEKNLQFSRDFEK